VQIIDLGIGWEWEHDSDFVLALDQSCQGTGLSSYLVHPHNLEETRERVRQGSLRFSVFLDRASDNVESMKVLVRCLKGQGAWIINDPEHLPRANDKATMHLELLAHGIHVPYTIIIGLHEGDNVDRVPELQEIGVPFIIKPANGGGGRGVILGAQGKVDVVQARKALWADKMLLQEEIRPAQLPGGMAWFRTFLVGEHVHLCWWNRENGHYRPVLPDEEHKFGLAGLRRITEEIGKICGLILFSTEIALSRGGQFVAIDYVNDQPDFRPQSKARDGVPDSVLRGIVTDIVQWVRHNAQHEKNEEARK